MCSVWFPQWTADISLHSINRLDFVAETWCVSCEVRTEFYILCKINWIFKHPCGGGFEYLHRDPASRRRRRKGKSQIWDSKIWSRVPSDSDPRKTALSRTSSIYKKQTRPLVRECATEKQDRNCQTAINIWSWPSDGARHQVLLIDWPSVAMWLWLWIFKGPMD
jgi:hypothetical protein